jgi:hypothetical protein
LNKILFIDQDFRSVDNRCSIEAPSDLNARLTGAHTDKQSRYSSSQCSIIGYHYHLWSLRTLEEKRVEGGSAGWKKERGEGGKEGERVEDDV